MSETVQPPTPWVYEGIWGVLSGVFCVPRSAPELPTQDAQSISSRKPSRSYLQYMKLQLCLVVVAVATPLTVVSIILAVSESPWFLLATAVILCLAGFLSLISLLAIHLHYDTMWYVFSDRSMRLRRGIWVICESTITFENIQNVKVIQGPLQRWFGISNVVVETAGGGSNPEQSGGLGMHSGVIEGVSDASEIRDSIMNQIRKTNSTGLGDEQTDSNTRGGWSESHIAILREIRDLAEQASAI